MKKYIFDLQGFEQKKSISAQQSTNHYEPMLSKYRNKTL